MSIPLPSKSKSVNVSTPIDRVILLVLRHGRNRNQPVSAVRSAYFLIFSISFIAIQIEPNILSYNCLKMHQRHNYLLIRTHTVVLLCSTVLRHTTHTCVLCAYVLTCEYSTVQFSLEAHTTEQARLGYME